MGVSSTRVGDHRGSARTVQFSIKFLYLMICILRSARICVSDTVIPTLLSRTLRALCLLPCVKALAYTPRCVLPCNCWAGSGLPFPWGFDSATALLPPSPQWCLHLISPFSNSSSSIYSTQVTPISPSSTLPALCPIFPSFSFLDQSFLCLVSRTNPRLFQAT